MSNLMVATQALESECDATREQLDAEPGNILLAMRLSRLQLLASMVKTFGVGSDFASGFIPVRTESEPSLDAGSNGSNELVGSGCRVTITDVCASERGRLEVDDLSSRSHQLSLPLDT